MDCTEAVYSNDYFDLIIEFDDVREAFQLSPCIQDLSERYSIGYWKRENLPPFGIRYYTYSAIPKIYTLLDQQALEASNITQIQNLPTLSLKGQGVLIGFIDTGIDYENPVFRNSDGTTRIEAIWDQTIREGPAPDGFFYGAEFVREQIDKALASDQPQQIVPTRDENGHGTYLASVAAGGQDPANDFSGAAPLSSIAVVKLKEAKEYLREFFFVKQDAIAYQENDIMAAVSYLDFLAFKRRMPLVLCIGLGTNSGNHAGNNPLANMLRSVAGRRQRAVVSAAGNEANSRHHFHGNILAEGQSELVEISVGTGVEGFTVELWSRPPELFSVEITSPSGERLSREVLSINKGAEYTFLFENTTVSVDYRISSLLNGAQIIFLRFARPTAGLWNVRVFGEEVVDGVFHMWLPMTEILTGEVYFIRSNPDTTITAPGNANFPMTVGGYNSWDDSIYLDSGRGYSTIGVIKPDFVAPAVDVFGAGLRNRFVSRTGTSSAAAISAGAAALLMEWGVVRENYLQLSSNEIKNIIIRGARRDPNRLYPNREWGDYVNIVPG